MATLKNAPDQNPSADATLKNHVQVKVRLFAMCRDVVGKDQLQLTLPAGSTTEQFWRHLLEVYPALAPYQRESRLAVNREYIFQERILQDGDEVSVIPPVSGG